MNASRIDISRPNVRLTGCHLLTSPDLPNFTGVLVDISGVKYVLCLEEYVYL
jgi:hypothetical protein